MTSEERRRSKSIQRREHHHQSSSSSYTRSDSNKSKSRIHDNPENLLSRKLEKLHDANGCCHIHTHVQIAKKKIMGGWKVLRPCPACSDGDEIRLDDDRLSVCSGRSAKSCKSNKSGGGSGRSGRKANRTEPKYDGEGYCCMHPSVRIAKKKTMGGWKLLVDFCPDCEAECEKTGSSRGRRRSVSRSRNLIRSLSRGRSKNADNDEDDTHSMGSSHSKHSIRSRSSNRSSSNRQLGPRKVKNLKIRDQNRVPGRYSGWVDENSRPDGKGIIRYENGMEWTGVWSAGEQCNGSLGGCKSNF
jgi:hypothetical protein